jgi:NAD(P)H-hydrate repair Nnr-like enzyme with NAD(P)H-hydrate epimerase domain
MNSTASKPGKHWGFTMASAIDIGISDMQKKGLRLAIGAVVATVVAMAGSGGNGGGALVAARRLHNWGAQVTVALGQPPQAMTPIPAHQLDILQRMGVAGANLAADPRKLALPGNEPPFELILDGLIGYSLKGAPTGLIGELIRFANDYPAPILALDAPSGIDTNTGTVFDPRSRRSPPWRSHCRRKACAPTALPTMSVKCI